jgi:hypothetical protein
MNASSAPVQYPIEISGVSLSFGSIEVLRDVSIAIAPWEFVAVIGPSGCGKSTLLNVLSGEVIPSSGLVSRYGQARMIYQHDGLFPWQTVTENISLGLRSIADDNERFRQLQELLELIQLHGFENHYRDETTYARDWGNQLQSDGFAVVPAYPDVWMRLTRVGNIMTTYRGTDGANWTQMANREFPNLAADLYVGMGYSPELVNNGAQAGLGHGVLARYRNYSITTSDTPSGDKKFTSIKIQGGNIVIEYTGSGVQSGDAVNGPWTDVPGPSPISVPIANGPKFYRFKP